MPGRGRFKHEEFWPEPDRTRWRRGLSPASLLHGTGHAAKWRPATRSKVGRAYATYLGWLDATGQLSDHEQPEQRFTPARIDANCTYPAETLAPASIRSQLTDLVRASSVIAPEADVTFLRRRAYCYPRTGDPLAKRRRMQEPEVLLQLGLDLMAAAESKTAKTRRTAVLYRDGLLIAVLACRAMRLRNLTSVEIGRHLTEKDEQWSLLFDATETKNHRTWENGWPESLVPHLVRYLEVYRPMLMGGRYQGDHLWISERPGPLTENGIYYAIVTRTKAAFGKPVNPHLFRDAAATSLAVHDPVNVQVGRHVLGHGHYRTMEEYYNQARSIEASASLNTALAKLRHRVQAKADCSED
jgi:integrase/recombinase XerD